VEHSYCICFYQLYISFRPWRKNRKDIWTSVTIRGKYLSEER